MPWGVPGGASPFAGGHDEKEQTLNQLLVEMDGFDATSGIVLLAATNRPEVLDPALLRAGRFDRQVLVDRPDRRGRVDVLKVHIKKVKIGVDVDLEQVAALTPGFTGADLANLVNEAALAATRRNAGSIALEDFNAGVERIVAGLERKNRLLNPREREIVAYHEMGHAIVASAVAGSDPVHKVSIIPRGIGALGYTIQRPTEDRFLMTRTELENRMAVLMGGRAAEHLIFGHYSTGAADDLAKIADIARSMIARYAMEPSLGHVAFETDQRSMLGPNGEALGRRNYGEDTAREIDCAVRTLVLTSFQRARAVLEENRVVLEESAQRLLQKETLDTADLEQLFKSLKSATATFSPVVPPCGKQAALPASNGSQT
jgi:cell division protease FtsH